MTTRSQTPSQTVGPFFSIGLSRPLQDVLVTDATPGERIRIEGAVLDGDGLPVSDALVEIWQANAHGRYRHALDAGPEPLDPTFVGFGRCQTDAHGVFRFDTVKPGAIADAGGAPHAPHVSVIVCARGLLSHAFTRIYFDDDPLETDPTLARVDVTRRSTLIAARTQQGGRVVYRWDIHLQGERETVFFDA